METASKPPVRHFRCPSWMDRDIREIAAATERSESEFIRAAIREYLWRYGRSESYALVHPCPREDH